jgi:cysteine-rich repeat protein
MNNHHEKRIPVAFQQALAVALLACLSGVGFADAACQSGRFLVQGEPLVAADVEPDAVVVDGASVAIRSGCDPVRAKVKVIRGRTTVRAGWRSCRDPRRKVSFKAVIDDACRMTGTLTFKHPRSRRSFVASPSACGDGIVDPEVAEGCDDGNLIGGDGCEADCTATPPPPTTSTTVPSTTTTTLPDEPPDLPPDDFPPDLPPDDFPPDLPPDSPDPSDLPF